jgi:large subunit ribosomal protein L21
MQCLPHGRCPFIRRIAVYAVIRSGGKQYRVEEGRSVKLDRLAGEPGETVELTDVLLLADGDDLSVGAPTVEGARVLGTIAEQGRSDKIIVFRYKAKTRSRKKTGHRQHFTRVVVEDILAAGQQPKPRAAPEPEAPVAEEAPKPRRGRRRAAEATTAAEEPAETTDAVEESATTAEAPTATSEATQAAEAELAAPAEAPSVTEPPPAEKPKRRLGRRKKEA